MVGEPRVEDPSPPVSLVTELHLRVEVAERWWVSGERRALARRRPPQ